MNTIYKVIWNDALQVFQAVNEITKSHRKHTSVRTGGGVCKRTF
ncbi:MAG TPA: ESPR domain-containing protein [Candidatus Aphodousia faecipullorum]|nr:ESPR domain-containing protein [Candidatus Aphodousia faecipullorum]